MSAPKSNILIMTRSSEHFVVRMHSKTPQLSPMAKHDLIKPSLKRTF